jgi:hypothetical protein
MSCRRSDRIHERARETGRRGEVLLALNYDHRHREVATKELWVELARLRHETDRAALLTLKSIIDIAERVPRRGERETHHAAVNPSAPSNRFDHVRCTANPRSSG